MLNFVESSAQLSCASIIIIPPLSNAESRRMHYEFLPSEEPFAGELGGEIWNLRLDTFLS